MRAVAVDMFNGTQVPKGDPSERVRSLRARLTIRMNEKIEWWGEGLTILDEKDILKQPLIIRKAKAVDKVLREMPISIFDSELIVGTMRMHSTGSGQTFPQYTTEEEDKAAASKSISPKSVWGHQSPDYMKVVSVGIDGIKKKILQRSKRPVDEKQRAFFQSAFMCCDAVIAFARRYSDLALELAKRETNELRKRELKEIADICLRVPEHPPRNFREALQSIWFTQLALHSTLEYVPFGRLDQILYPFFRDALSTHQLTFGETLELIECLYIKCNETLQMNSEHRENHRDFGDFSLGHDPGGKDFINDDPAYENSINHTVTLGGQNELGEECSNELTYLFLEAMEKVEVLQPALLVRLSRKSPEWLYQKCSELIRAGGGLPVMYNDDVLIPAIFKEGIPAAEARTYASSGCWEVLIPVKSEFRWSPIHSLKCLEYVFTRGMNVDKRKGVDTGDVTEFKSFEEVLDAFKIQLDHHIKTTMDNVVKYYGCLATIAPDPLLSVLMDDCLERGLDITEGGATHVIHSMYLTGLPNTADGLAAIKKLVFEEKELSLGRLKSALDRNFEEEELLRQRLINGAPKFGNDNDFVDDIHVDVSKYFIQRVKAHAKDVNRIKFFCGIGTMPTYRFIGKRIGATPDGRKSGEPLSSNMTPYPGRDMSGPTAVLSSGAKVKADDLAGGAAMDLYMTSSSVSGVAGLKRLSGFLKSFVESGCSVLSITTTDNKALVAAQKEPEKHRNLRVRMGGWQAYFVALDTAHQDYILRRSKHECN